MIEANHEREQKASAKAADPDKDAAEMSDNDYSPFTGIGVGTGIFVINKALGIPAYTVSSDSGYYGKPCIRCFYSTGGNYYEVTYHVGSNIGGGKISQRLFDKWHALADRRNALERGHSSIFG